MCRYVVISFICIKLILEIRDTCVSLLSNIKLMFLSICNINASYIYYFVGASLVINSSWKNPSGEWHVGCKLVYELFTDTLTSRVKVILVAILFIFWFFALSKYL